MNALLRVKAAQSLACMVLATGAIMPDACDAQQQINAPSMTATPRWDIERFHSNDALLEMDLDRTLLVGERIAMIAGNTDVSAALEVRGRHIRYQPTTWRLPAGVSEAVVYLIVAEQWQEIGRAPIRVLNRLGLEASQLRPSLDLSTTGPLNQRTETTALVTRRAYQDVTLRLGLESELQRDGWEVATQFNALGTSEASQRLRFAESGLEAPRVDLADYRIRIARSGVQFGIGNLNSGSNRHLLNGFASRGVSATVALGPAMALSTAVLNGSNTIGWSNLLSVSRPNHRIAVGQLDFELLPSRPGAFHLEVSTLDGSVLPLSGFTQGAALDAEESRGLGFQVALSDARQRIRFAGGLTRSRFANPSDPLLFGDTSVVPVAPVTRSARHGELSVQLLQGARLGAMETSLGATLRHERVDPLFRSVGGYVQSDMLSDGVDVAATLGRLSLQGSMSAARDNLGNVTSILTSRTRGHGLNIAAPLAPLLGLSESAWFLPNITYAWQRTRQYGEGVPENGDFSESHVPDQLSTAQSGSAAWTAPQWSLTYQINHSFQDNRQVGRDGADFRGVVHALSLALSTFQHISPSLDVSVERQKSFELGFTQHTERVGGSVQGQLTPTTGISAALSHAWGLDPFADQRTRNTEYQAELSQGFDLYRRKDGGQARVFLRYSRTRAALWSLSATPGQAPRVLWTLTAGGSIRLF